VEERPPFVQQSYDIRGNVQLVTSFSRSVGADTSCAITKSLCRHRFACFGASAVITSQITHSGACRPRLHTPVRRSYFNRCSGNVAASHCPRLLSPTVGRDTTVAPTTKEETSDTAQTEPSAHLASSDRIDESPRLGVCRRSTSSHARGTLQLEMGPSHV